MKEKVAPTRPRPRLSELAAAPAALDDLVDLVDRAMALEPRDRPDAAEVAEALDAMRVGAAAARRRARAPVGIALVVVALAVLAGLGRAVRPAAPGEELAGDPARPAGSAQRPRAAPVGDAPAVDLAAARNAVLRAVNALTGGRPVADAAELARPGLVALDADDGARRELRAAAIERMRAACVELALGDDPVDRADDAMRALVLASDAGEPLRDLAYELTTPLAQLVRAVNDLLKRSSRDDEERILRAAAVLEAAAEAVRAGLRDPQACEALVDLAESCDRRPQLERASVSAEAALRAVLPVLLRRARPSFVLGKLLACRFAASGRDERLLLVEARRALAGALERARTTDPTWSDNDRAVALVIAGDLADAAGEPVEVEALLAGPHRPGVQATFERDRIGAFMLRVRARARVRLGLLPEARIDLLAAAAHLRALGRAESQASLLEAAAELLERGDADAALQAIPPLDPL